MRKVPFNYYVPKCELYSSIGTIGKIAMQLRYYRVRALLLFFVFILRPSIVAMDDPFMFNSITQEEWGKILELIYPLYPEYCLEKFVQACKDRNLKEAMEVVSDIGVHWTAPDGTTPLMCAVVGRLVPVAENLLERGAVVDAETVDGKTALSVAKALDDQAMVAVLQRAV